MKRTQYMLAVGLSLCLFGCAGRVAVVDAAGMFSCTNLSRDLGSGSNDSKTGGEVTKLQNFLKAAGYLLATPNGNFGPATTAAVKGFQSATGISTTGTVGPLTRIALQIKSCAVENTGTPVTTVPVSATTPVTTPSTTVSSSNSSVAQGVSSPKPGEKLLIGQIVNVIWDKTGSNQNVVLEDNTGLARGFITSSRGGTNSYPWKVGYVFSSQSQTEVRMPPGTYRIRITGSGTDQTSGVFTIGASPLIITSLMPREIVADNNASMVAFGSGFTPGMSIIMDDQYGFLATKLYVSPDGKVLVFAIPPSTTVGTHSIILDNSYGDSVMAGQVTVTSSGTAQ